MTIIRNLRWHLPWMFILAAVIAGQYYYTSSFILSPPHPTPMNERILDDSSFRRGKFFPRGLLAHPPPPQQQQQQSRSPSKGAPRHKYKDISRKSDQLVRVIDSIIYYGQQQQNSSNTEQPASREVIQALGQLRSARTPGQIHQAGQRLTADLIEPQESRPIQERLLKALALAGLTENATALLRRQLQHGYLPSYISYTAVLSGLRRAGRIDTLREVLQELVDASKAREKSIHIMALSLYLAALCDNSFHRGGNDMVLLDEASQWVLDSKKALLEFGIPLDLTCYNTVLNGAAKAGNQTLVNAIWDELVSSSTTVQPDIRSYNARMSATTSYAERSKIWEELMQTNRPDLVPDRFTIDLILLPMMMQQNEDCHDDDDENENDEDGYSMNKQPQQDSAHLLETVLDNFVAHHSEAIVRDAFSAFFNTLVQNGKLTYARRLFDMYIAPCLKRNVDDDNQDEEDFLDRLLDSSQRPDTRHFNILIDGYRREAMNAGVAAASSAVAMNTDEKNQQQQQQQDRKKGESIEEYKMRLLVQAKKFTRQQEAARAEGRKLFELLNKAGLAPDSYTLTSMMALCESSLEVAELLVNPLYKRCLSAAVVRSAMTASGQLRDPGLACAIFDRYHSQPKFSQPNDPRLWNVLLNALSESAEQDNPRIETDSKATNLFLETCSKTDPSVGDPTMEKDTRTLILLQGKTCTDAVREVIPFMTTTDNSTDDDDDDDAYPHPVSWKSPPNSQTYCVVAAALQYDPEAGPVLAMELFRNATRQGIPADGRFINAIFRCFGDDINQALVAWKSEIRKECVKYESSRSNRNNRSDDAVSARRPTNKNLIAAYNGLLHVCGRAQRPDIGVRLVYALKREDIEPNEESLNNYRAGKRLRNRLVGITVPATAAKQERTFGGGQFPKLVLPQLNMVQQYENILYVECTKYNQYDKRMSKDTRVRIIV